MRRLRSDAARPAAPVTRLPTRQPDRAIPGSAAPTLGIDAHNLPAPFASFVGREHQIVEIGRLLEAHRLVTLAGAPGVGKTRLAIQVAGQVRATSPDGVWLVELAGLDEPALAAAATTRALGVREAGRTAVDALLQELRDRALLLILDNCEHLLDACSALAEALLSGCPGVRVLATSRQPLGLTGEVAWRVPALGVPQPPEPRAGPVVDARALAVSVAETDPPLRVLSSEAGRLFVERAQAARATFEVNASNAAAIGEICRRVDGLPLAIELAAARIAHLTPRQIADRLDQRFRLLANGRASNAARHSTLRALVDWSYDLLSDAERIVLQRLAVFAGGWTLEAAEAVCDKESGGEGQGASQGAPQATLLPVHPSSPVPPPSTLDLLGRLIDKSLVHVDEHSSALRYTMHETVRDYALERLDERGDSPEVRRRHVLFYLALAEDAQARLFGTELQPLLDELEREHDNLRLALRWSSEMPSGDVGPRLAGALWRFWQVRGHLREGRAWLERLLTEVRPAGPTDARARALNAIGFLTFLQGDYRASQPLLEASVEIWRALDDRRGLVEALTNLGVLLRCIGESARARSTFEESIALSRALGDRAWEGRTLNKLARLTFYERDLVAARTLHEDGLVAVRRAGNAWDIAIALGDLADVCHALGDDATAHRLYTESLGLWLELGDERGIAQGLEGFAILASGESRWARAVRLIGAAQAIRERITEPSSPHRGATLETLLNDGRAILGDRYASIWAGGCAMAPSLAAAEALSHDDSVLPVLAAGAASAAVTSPPGTGSTPLAPVPPPGGRPALAPIPPSTPSGAPDATSPSPGTLSSREYQVVALVSRGVANPEIANALVVSRRTVEWHVGNILGKLGLQTRAQLVAWARDHGISPSA